jgi:ribonuclease HI
MSSLGRKLAISSSPELKQEYTTARNIYFNTIKVAKTGHWNAFLEKEDPKSIFKAMAYTKDLLIQPIPSIRNASTNTLEDSFSGKCQAFKSTLFPDPPKAPEIDLSNYQEDDYWKWPKLSKTELENACTAKIKGKTPGPDLITQEIITYAYQAVPEVFYSIYSMLIDTGYHPHCWRQATGFILKKPNKPDYSAPKAYRVISLLNCLGKVSERILARRLGYLAETTHLLHPTQIGGRLRKSAIDAALLLANEVEQNHQIGLKTSTLFLDVKGAFDHVAKNQLLAILKQLRLPLSLITWVSSFLENRQLKLAFNQNIEEFTVVNTGIPQGSPISPILFLIYIRDLFSSNTGKYLSYIDDISVTVTSSSFKKNAKMLEREAGRLVRAGENSAISFDIAKTELLHFSSSKVATEATLQMPDKSTVTPKQVVKWLGIYFDQCLTFKHHVNTRTSQAKSAYYRMNRLANTGRGLSPYALRQIYQACVTSVSDYGSVIWWRGQRNLLQPLQALQNQGVRKILGVFKTAPIKPMEVEAALPPPEIRLNSNIRKYAFRVLKLSPSHPVNVEIQGIQSFIDNFETRIRTTKPTQIQRIHASIQGLVDIDSLEQIQHFYYAPWEHTTPYQVKINKASKSDAATAHNQHLNTIKGSNIISIYTDASALPDQIGVGVGIAAFDNSALYIPETPTYTKHWNIGPQQLVYNGELDGVTTAIEYASSIAAFGDHFDIYSDNQAGLYRLKTPSDYPGQTCQIRSFTAAQAIVDTGASITINWVPGHTDITGNEIADSLAKEATKLDPLEEETSFAILGLRIKALDSQEWLQILTKYRAQALKTANLSTYSRNFPWKISRKLQLPLGVKRAIASSFYQLKLGHGYIKTYLNRFKHTTDDKCQCGQRETVDHLLLSCKKLKLARKQLYEKLGTRSLTLPLLLHTKTGIENTLVFLADTRICTRGWHLQRTAGAY